MSSPQSPSLMPAFVTVAPPPPQTPPQPIKMSKTTPPRAPKKRPGFFEASPPKKQDPLASLDRLFPPGQWVSLSLTPEEEEAIFESSCKNLPVWFHFENRNGTLYPRSLADKKKLAAALEPL